MRISKKKRLERDALIEDIYRNGAHRVHVIRRECVKHGIKRPDSYTVKKVITKVKHEISSSNSMHSLLIDEEGTESNTEQRTSTVDVRVPVIVKKKPCTCNDEEPPDDYVEAHGSYSCPYCYKGFRGSAIVKSTGGVFTETTYDEVYCTCPHCGFLLGKLSDFKAAWDKKHPSK